MTLTTPAETGWDTAPGLLDGAKTLTLTARQCDLPYWLESVAQGTLAGRARTGHAEGCPTPRHMRVPGPLRDGLIAELAQRSLAEDKATRLLAHYVAHAPGVPELEFYATQLMDEARHAQIFRHHLLEMDVPADELAATMAAVGDDYSREVLEPIEEYALRVVRDEGDFIGGVAIFTIVIEGVLAPAAELSERKWERLDPAASEIARGAAIDEIRHLTVGSSLIRDHLIAHPGYRPRLLEIMRDGRRLWDELPDRKYVMIREELFQAGMAAHAGLLAGYEVWPGRLLLDTTPDERYDTADRWTEEMAVSRLGYMGLADALPILLGDGS
jgi:hypothetical protein